MEQQNTTLSLPKDLLKKAKALAASRHLSLSELMRQLLEEKVMKESCYRAAKNRQLKLMRKGLDLETKGKIAFSRDELHTDKSVAEIVPCESKPMPAPLKDTVKFVEDIVSPAVKKDRKASR